MHFEIPDNPRAVYATEDGSMIDCDLVHDGKVIRFTASANDPEPHGREIYEALKASATIAPYTPPASAE